MRVPYAVGRWVRGRAHYDRDQLVETLLYAPQTTHWLIATRRMGKTSLLRHLELIAENAAEGLAPLFWDMQGSGSPEELTRELVDAIDMASPRFAGLAAGGQAWDGLDAVAILQILAQALAARNCQLLLLVDEAEVLIQVSRQHPEWVNRLIAVLADASLRVVLASTKGLARLGEDAGDRTDYPLRRGFHVVFLCRLDEPAARALVRQEQSDRAVQAEEGTVDDIIIHTNGHPYLTQFLCQRLFAVDGADQGFLRPVRDEDLEPDHLLAALFANDFRSLTSVEQRLVLSVAKRRVARLRELVGDVPEASPENITLCLYGLDRLGFLRRVFGQWAVGNEYLQRWLTAEASGLAQTIDVGAEDSTQVWLIEAARENEIHACREQLLEAEAELRELEESQLSLIGEETRLMLERGAQLRRRIAKLKRDLGEIAETPLS